MQQTLIDRLLAGAAINPAAPAIIDGGRIFSHQTVLSLVGATARRLHREGLEPGNIVGVTMHQGALHCIASLALARLGVAVVPLAPDLDVEVRNRLIATFDIATLVTTAAPPADLPCHALVLDGITAGPGDADLNFMDYQPSPETPLRLALSSGTTRDPRGVMQSHGNWVRRMDRMLVNCDRLSRLLPPDLHITPGINTVHGMLCAGAAVVFPRDYTREGLVQTINQCAVTHLIMTPANIKPLAAALPEQGFLLPTLKHLRLVGSTPGAALLERLLTHCTPNVCVPYGLTELGPISMADATTLARHPDSAGRVLPWARVEIVDDAERPVPAGTGGEIRVAVEFMPNDYYRAAGDVGQRFRNGWFYPGDHGRLSEEGLLYVEGRIDDILNIGGHKISPETIEAVLCSHPEISDAAVFQQSVNGEPMLIALLVAGSGARLDDLATLAGERLAFMAPQHYRLVQQLPRNSMGKLERKELAALATVREPAP